MNSVNLIYQNGHFYKKDTGKRVVFKTGKEFCVVSDTNAFEEPKQAGRIPKEILKPDELINKLKARKPAIEFHKILNCGDIVYFTIKQDKSYLFKVRLMEDLYLYRPAGNPDAEFALFDCQAQTIENVGNEINYFEIVSGKSLNDLRKCTYVHYFGNHGNPAANALTDFTLPDHKTTLSNIRDKVYVRMIR